MAITDPRIGWVSSAPKESQAARKYGLGSMGLPIAMNLQRHLSRTAQTNLTYYNRTIASGKPLQDLGASPAINLLELVDKCDVIFTMVRIL
jgi:3-hydroxyisobutyrate dehydrogenase-like beta-hydroxyacid dehydrogenase